MNIEVSFLSNELSREDCGKLIKLLADGVCDYLLASRKICINKIVEERAVKALKKARDISAKCSEAASENGLLSGGSNSIM